MTCKILCFLPVDLRLFNGMVSVIKKIPRYQFNLFMPELDKERTFYLHINHGRLDIICCLTILALPSSF